MNVKVIKKFKDKNTSEIRKVDDVFEVTEKRFAELKGFVEEVKENIENDSEKTESKRKRKTEK